MHFTPHVDFAFDPIEEIRRDVNYGNIIQKCTGRRVDVLPRRLHPHLRGLYYGSYKPPREVLWMIGVLILLVMMATAFLGYVLPWGQMSFWAAKVITNLFSAIPFFGESIVTWLWGGFGRQSDPQRFFSLHYLLPFVLVGLVFLHIWALHVPATTTRSGSRSSPQDTVVPPLLHDEGPLRDRGVLLLFAAFMFFAPDYLGHPINYAKADPLVTPTHIVPEWYFLPYYAILRSIPTSCSASSRCSARS